MLLESILEGFALQTAPFMSLTAHHLDLSQTSTDTLTSLMLNLRETCETHGHFKRRSNYVFAALTLCQGRFNNTANRM